MPKFLDAARSAAPRLLLLPIIFAVLLTSSCRLFGTHTKVQVPALLKPLAEANKDQLIEEINRLTTVKSMHGTVTMQRPGKIYLIIQFTFVDIAQMASDGEHFSVAVLKGDDKYKRFVKGTNSAVYPKLDNDGTANAKAASNKKEKDGEKQTVSALSNLRPQHLTEALMIRPVEPNDSLIYSQSEFFQEEPDMRLQAKKNGRVMRGYYLLDELSAPKNGESKLLRRFWFDRVDGIRLARLQTYDDRGELITDVSYFDDKVFGSDGSLKAPARIAITRPKDQYKLSISYQDPASVELNQDYPARAFVLENKWQLPEVDLDAQLNKKVIANH